MMFLRSIASVFSGVSAFPEMAKRNPFRAVFHLLLFCLLSALVCAGLRILILGKKIDAGTAGLDSCFGQVKVSSAGIVPEKNGEKGRTVYLPGDFRLDYLKAENLPIVSGMGSWKHRQGVFWVPRGFVMWLHPDPARDLFYIAQIPYPFGSSYLLSPMKLQTIRPYQANDVQKFLEPFFQPVKGKEIAAETFTFQDTGRVLKRYLYLIFVLISAGSHFVLTMIMVCMFGAMQSFWRAPGLEQLKFGGTVSLLSYAAYPAVLAGILLENLSFPTGSEITFFILFFICQLIAFNEIRRVSSGGTQD